MSDLKLSDLDATSGYNSIALDPDKVEKLIAENKVLRTANELLSEAVGQSEIVLRVLGEKDKADILLRVLKMAEALKEKETK